MRKSLTTELFNTTTINEEPLLQTLKDCIDNGWSMEMYCSWLAQFFQEETIDKVIEPRWNNLTTIKRFSKFYTNEDLCELHDKYMEIYDIVIDTHLEWILTASYPKLLKSLDTIDNSHTSMLVTFMLVYKQNVYEIDAANDARNNQ